MGVFFPAPGAAVDRVAGGAAGRAASAPADRTWLLSVAAGVLALCSTVCLALLMVVGTAQCRAIRCRTAGRTRRSVMPCPATNRGNGRHSRPVRRDGRLLAGALAPSPGPAAGRRGARRVPRKSVAVLPDEVPYAYALPGGRRGRVVVSTAMLATLNGPQRRALFAHERVHLTLTITGSCWWCSWPRRRTGFFGRCVRRCPTPWSGGRTRRRRPGWEAVG